LRACLAHEALHDASALSEELPAPKRGKGGKRKGSKGGGKSRGKKKRGKQGR
jgi:hypothetical protein